MLACCLKPTTQNSAIPPCFIGLRRRRFVFACHFSVAETPAAQGFAVSIRIVHIRSRDDFREHQGETMRLIHGLVMWASSRRWAVPQAARVRQREVRAANRLDRCRHGASRGPPFHRCRHPLDVLPSEQHHARRSLRHRRRNSRHRRDRDRDAKEQADRPGQGARVVRRPQDRPGVFLAQRRRRRLRAAHRTTIFTVPATGRKAEAHRADRTRLHRLGQCRRDACC